MATESQESSDPASSQTSGDTKDDGDRHNYRRALADKSSNSSSSSSSSGIDFYMDGSALDIAVFHLVSCIYLYFDPT